MGSSEPASHLDELIGTEWLESGEEAARGRFLVADHHKQPFGLVHGGLYCVLAESICSRATAGAVWDSGQIAVGQANDTSMLRPVTEGHVNASARRMHAGRTTWVWEVELTDDQGRLCALSRITMAIRARPEAEGPSGGAGGES